MHGTKRRQTLSSLILPQQSEEIRKEIVVNNLADYLVESMFRLLVRAIEGKVIFIAQVTDGRRLGP